MPGRPPKKKVKREAWYITRILRPEKIYVLRRSLASLARAYKIHVVIFFFLLVHLGGASSIE